MQIHAPTAIFNPRKNEQGEIMYWPDNELAEQLCYFGDLPCVTADKLDILRNAGIRVEIKDASSVKPMLVYRDAATGKVQAVGAYQRRKQLQPRQPKHFNEVA